MAPIDLCVSMFSPWEMALLGGVALLEVGEDVVLLDEVCLYGGRALKLYIYAYLHTYKHMSVCVLTHICSYMRPLIRTYSFQCWMWSNSSGSDSLSQAGIKPKEFDAYLKDVMQEKLGLGLGLHLWSQEAVEGGEKNAETTK